MTFLSFCDIHPAGNRLRFRPGFQNCR